MFDRKKSLKRSRNRRKKLVAVRREDMTGCTPCEKHAAPSHVETPHQHFSLLFAFLLSPNEPWHPIAANCALVLYAIYRLVSLHTALPLKWALIPGAATDESLICMRRVGV
jgi:hypothetical protein